MNALYQSHNNPLLLLFIFLSLYHESKGAMNLPFRRNFHSSMSLMKIGRFFCEWQIFVINDDDDDDFFLTKVSLFTFSGNYTNSFSY